MKKEINLSVLGVSYGVQVKIKVTSPGFYYEKQYLKNLQIIVWHRRKNASFHFAPNMLFQCNHPNVHGTRNSTFFLKNDQDKYLLLLIIIMRTGIQRRVKKILCLSLTGGNWQKWKRVFLTCPCHEIYRDEAVGLKSCKNTWKITIFVKMWNLGQYRENLIFCQ